MPKLSGLFDSFDNLDQIDINNLISWLRPAPTLIALENYLANKILYPQTLPITDYDMKLDLAILREALRLNAPILETNTQLESNPFLNITSRKMMIPERFLHFTRDLVSLVWAFVDGLLLSKQRKSDFFEGFGTVVLTDDVDEIVGSIIIPKFGSIDDTMILNLLGRSIKIKAGSLTIVPCPRTRCEIAYKLSGGKLLGKKEAALEVYGGKLGLVIDWRNK